MPKLLFVIVAVSIILGACNRTTKEVTSTPKKMEAPKLESKKEEPKVVRIESYDAFYKQFHEDSLFQIKRIKFPVGGYYSNIDGELVQWNKNNWQMHRAMVQNVDTSIYTVDVKKTVNESIEVIQIEGSGFKTERKFKCLQGKWYLIYYSDDNY